MVSPAASGLGRQVRAYNVHECDAQDLMAKHGIPVARGSAVTTAADAESAAVKMQDSGVNDYVVKAQVLAGAWQGLFYERLQRGRSSVLRG